MDIRLLLRDVVTSVVLEFIHLIHKAFNSGFQLPHPLLNRLDSVLTMIRVRAVLGSVVYVRSFVITRREAALNVSVFVASSIMRRSPAFPRYDVMYQRPDLMLEPHKTCDHWFHPSLNVLDVRSVLNRHFAMFFASLKSKVW